MGPEIAARAMMARTGTVNMRSKLWRNRAIPKAYKVHVAGNCTESVRFCNAAVWDRMTQTQMARLPQERPYT